MARSEYKGIPENTTKGTHRKAAEMVRDETIKRILDIPCGHGAFTQRMLDKGKEMWSLDIEDGAFRPDPERFVKGDMTGILPFEDGQFDAAVCIDGIEHIEKPFDFIRECGRILNSNGKLVISTPNINSIRSRWKWFLTGHHLKNHSPLDETNPQPRHHINMLSFTELRYMLHSNGFKITELATNRIKPINWLYVFAVPFTRIITGLVYRKEEKDTKQRKRNREILKQLYTVPLLFGETLIVKAEKL